MPQHVGMQGERHEGRNVRVPQPGECGAGHISAIGGWDNIPAQVWCIRQDGSELVRDRNDSVRGLCFEIIYRVLLIVQKGHSAPDGQRAALNASMAMHHQMVASALAVKLGHELCPGAMIGCMMTRLCFYAYTCKPEDNLATQQRMRGIYRYVDIQVFGEYPRYLLKEIERKGLHIKTQPEDAQILKEGTVDFVSFSYYMTSCMAAQTNGLEMSPGNTVNGVKNPYLTSSEWGWQTDPIGLRISLVELYDRFRKPLFIVENGLGARDTLTEDGKVHDPYRIEYLKEHVKAMSDAINIDGVDLIGYTWWGCIDLISESTRQMSKRYGFVYVDLDDEGRGTYKRYRKDSFYYYKKLIAANGNVDAVNE